MFLRSHFFKQINNSLILNTIFGGDDSVLRAEVKNNLEFHTIMGCCSSTGTETQESDNIVSKSELETNDELETVQPLTLLTKTSHNTFVQLMLINRILFLDKLNTNTNHATSVNDIVEKLAHMEYGTKMQNKEKEMCLDILSTLQKHNINIFIKKYFKDTQCNMINLIYDKIIVECHKNEYEKQITAESITNEEKTDVINDNFEYLLFNKLANDLTINIFNYLNLENICDCSKINFIWLYNSFNFQSIYDINYKNVERISYGYNNLRTWQRILNVHSIDYDARSYFGEEFINNFNYLNNVRNVSIQLLYELNTSDMNFMKIINNKWNKIEHLFVFRSGYPLGFCSKDQLKSINNSDKTMPLFKFSNINSIKLTSVRLAFLCTNKCHTLDLGGIKIDIKWYNILIGDNCDLSGIKVLYIGGVTIESSSNNKNKQEKINKLCQKFINLKKLSISSFTSSGLEICLGLKSIIIKNKCQVEMKFSCISSFLPPKIKSEYIEKISFIEKNEIIITNVELVIGTNDEFDNSKYIIDCKQIRNNVQVLKFYNNKDKFDSFFVDFQAYLSKNEIIFPNLKQFDFMSPIDTIKDLDEFTKFFKFIGQYFNQNSKYGVLFGTSLRMSRPYVKELGSNEDVCSIINTSISNLFDMINNSYVETLQPVDFNLRFGSQEHSDVLDVSVREFNKKAEKNCRIQLQNVYQTFYKYLLSYDNNCFQLKAFKNGKEMNCGKNQSIVDNDVQELNNKKFLYHWIGNYNNTSDIDIKTSLTVNCNFIASLFDNNSSASYVNLKLNIKNVVASD